MKKHFTPVLLAKTTASPKESVSGTNTQTIVHTTIAEMRAGKLRKPAVLRIGGDENTARQRLVPFLRARGPQASLHLPTQSHPR